ncbi:transcriptional regulator GcvA [Dokdonella soli]|uniref:Transcriptional regulator GcvA n=1 Tax=Dokdonella soli TaxID=529810 RepID=A0ABN1IIT3_9GAMM
MGAGLPPLTTLRAFEAAARLNSFSRAAEDIHLTPSAISHQIKALEEYLGVRLFVRNGKRQVTLTREGAFLSQHVSAALTSMGEAADALRRGQRNRLTVSVLPSFAARWLMPRIGLFVDRHPGLDLTIRSTTAHADFLRDEVDLAIRFGTGQWPNLQAELFMHDALFPVCSPRLLRGKKARQISDLKDWAWLESDPEGWERWFAAADAALPRGKRRLDFGDASLALQAAIDGSGIALTRQSIAERELASGAVVRLFPAIAAASQYSYYFVWPAKATLTQNGVAFRDWLLAQIGPTDRGG